MRPGPSLLAFGLAASLGCAIPLCPQELTLSPSPLASAKTIYFEDQSGVDAVGAKALEELAKWGRFGIVGDSKRADLIVLLVRDPDRGGNLIFANGQTGSIDPSGRVETDSAPTFNKLAPVSYAFLQVVNPRTGQEVWSASHRWGGLLTGFDTAGERLVKQLEKATQQADDAARLKLVQTATPEYPSGLQGRNVTGTVMVQIVVDKHGKVTSAKAASGPTELLRASEDVARQRQFEPLARAPVTSNLEITYSFSVLCPSGVKAARGTVFYDRKLPMTTGHPGELKVLDILEEPMPPYPASAREAGKEGDLKLFLTVDSSGEVIGVHVLRSLDAAIDEAAVETLRKWKFKVSRGETAGFPLTISYRLSCDSNDAKH